MVTLGTVRNYFFSRDLSIADKAVLGLLYATSTMNLGIAAAFSGKPEAYAVAGLGYACGALYNLTAPQHQGNLESMLPS